MAIKWKCETCKGTEGYVRPCVFIQCSDEEATPDECAYGGECKWVRVKKHGI